MVRQPHAKVIHVYWLRDVSGEWLMRSDTNRRHLQQRRGRERANQYECTEIEQYVPRIIAVNTRRRTSR